MSWCRFSLALAVWVAAALLSTGPARALTCVGDCNGDGAVRIDELVTGVNVGLGNRPLGDCAAFECPDILGGAIVNCAVAAVNNALLGCPTAQPTATATSTVTPVPATSTVTPAGSRSCTLTRTATITRTGTRTATRTVTPTCPPTPPPNTCPAGSVIACAHPYCFIDCGCGTETPTPTPSASCTPGANPAPGCAYEGPTFTATHSPCHEAATPTPAPPELELELRAVPFADEQRVDIVGTIHHRGGSPVSYRAGCTARCRPPFYQPIAVAVAAPDGAPVLLDDECMGPYLCPEGIDTLLPGFSETTTLSLIGTALAHTETYAGECFTDCPQQLLVAGRYLVTARFAYWVGLDRTGPEGSLSAAVELDWPPAPASRGERRPR